jgi:hypothetical protein
MIIKDLFPAFLFRSALNLLRIFYVPSEENDAARSYNTLEIKTTASEMYTNTTAMTRQKTSNATQNPFTAQKP